MGRADRRVILKQTIAEVSRGGMDLRASSSDQSWAVIAATRILIDILDGHGPMRASRAAERAHEFFETSIKRNASGTKIECKQGCAFCCHVAVSALAPEVFHIANTIRARHSGDFEARLAGIRAAASATRGVSGFDRARQRFPCALLRNNECTVYAARPSPCRGVSSLSVRVCERSFRGESAVIPIPVVWETLRNAELQAMMAALTAVGLPSESYELNEAVCVALENPAGEARWLKGEDVFAGVSRLRLDSPAIAENNRKVVARLIAGALGKELPGGA
jgi:Fe-S-cluster containining protein